MWVLGWYLQGGTGLTKKGRYDFHEYLGLQDWPRSRNGEIQSTGKDNSSRLMEFWGHQRDMGYTVQKGPQCSRAQYSVVVNGQRYHQVRLPLLLASQEAEMHVVEVDWSTHPVSPPSHQ